MDWGRQVTVKQSRTKAVELQRAEQEQAEAETRAAGHTPDLRPDSRRQSLMHMLHMLQMLQMLQSLDSKLLLRNQTRERLRCVSATE